MTACLERSRVKKTRSGRAVTPGLEECPVEPRRRASCAGCLPIVAQGYFRVGAGAPAGSEGLSASTIRHRLGGERQQGPEALRDEL